MRSCLLFIGILSFAFTRQPRRHRRRHADNSVQSARVRILGRRAH